MTATASVRVQGQVSGLPNGTNQVGPIDITSANASGQVQWVVLQSGANTITCPASPTPTAAIITLNSANTAEVTLKGVTGDTGVGIGKTGTTVLALSTTTPPANFCLTSASTQTGLATQITFI